jgi:hypothetical protein
VINGKCDANRVQYLHVSCACWYLDKKLVVEILISCKVIARHKTLKHRLTPEAVPQKLGRGIPGGKNRLPDGRNRAAFLVTSTTEVAGRDKDWVEVGQESYHLPTLLQSKVGSR